MKSKWIVLIATLLALLASIPLYALFQPLYALLQKDDFQISTSVFMVLLDVSVKDSRGGYVSNLTKDDFRIEENGVAQKIASFNSGDTPVTAGLVLDDSGSMGNKRSDVNEAGVDFVKASNRQDQIFVVNFNDKVRMGLPPAVDFSDDVEVLRAALAHDKPAGRTALYDAIALSLLHLDQGQQSKKTLVVVSDGGDNISTVSQAKAIQLIEESHATVYTVGIYDPEDQDKNPKILERIARISGGESFFPESPSDIERVFDKIARDIRNRYTIGYVPSSGGNSKLRHVKVTASAAGHGHLQIRTRTSYLAPDEFVTKAEK